jgi:anti-sigma factor RsiW
MNDSPTDDDLTRLADGTLPGAHVAALRARVQSDPELSARLREQQRGVALMRASEEIVAPASLHAAIHGQTSQRRSRVRGPARWRPRLLAPLTATMGAAAVIVIVLVSGGSRSLTVTQTAQVSALASPTRGAPAVDRGDTDLLSLRVGSIHFPAYERQTDSRATGARTDHLRGREVQTVFYDIAGRRVGYSIIAGGAVPVPRGSSNTIQGVRYVTTTTGDARLVTWRRAGHTCVIAARRITRRTLLSLAAATQAT